MDETHRLILQENQESIVEKLNINEDLYDILVLNGVLTDHEVAELGIRARGKLGLPDHRRGEVC